MMRTEWWFSLFFLSSGDFTEALYRRQLPSAANVIINLTKKEGSVVGNSCEDSMRKKKSCC